MGAERREHPRFEIMAQIRVKGGSVNYIMDIKNISETGILVTADKLKRMPWFRFGQQLEMFIFAVEDLENIQLKGRIVWISEENDSKAGEFGVEFVDMTRSTRNKLRKLVLLAAKRTGHPPPLPLKPPILKPPKKK